MAPSAQRLDKLLVDQGAMRTRAKAQEAIAQGRVSINGQTVTKASASVRSGDKLAIKAAEHAYVTRAGGKLASALQAFDINPAGHICLDAGCAHGGFCDVLLQQGAAHVYALDVATDQLDPALAADPRVTSLAGINIRYWDRPDTLPAPTLVVADLSFISLTLVLGKLVDVASSDAIWLPMIKPQFEVGKGGLTKQGVVTNPDNWRLAITKVLDCAADLGLHARGLTPSGVPGPQGNVEFFVWLEADRPGPQPSASDMLDQAIRSAQQLAPIPLATPPHRP